MMDLSREMQRQAVELTSQRDREADTRWSLRLGNAPVIKNALTLASKLEGIATHHSDLDRDPLLLGVTNGTVDLRTGKFREARRKDLITKCAGTAYNASATCPTWEEFLVTVTGGDKELIRFLQQAIGYSLTGMTTEQCMIFLYGLGCNGKTTYVETIAALLGSYAQGAPESLFAKDPRGGIEATNDMAKLCGSRFAYGVELEEGTAMAESKVKRLTGGDSITARQLYKDYFTFNPTHTLWISGNHKPRIKGTDLGIWRRIRLVPFGVQISEEQKDGTLPEQLRGELAGILNWAIAGCLVWQEHGLIAPSVVRNATAEYRGEEDLLGQFLKERTQECPGVQVPKKALYEQYCRWCQEEGIKTPLTKHKLGAKLKERGFEDARSSKARSWAGLDLLAESTPR